MVTCSLANQNNQNTNQKHKARRRSPSQICVSPSKRQQSKQRTGKGPVHSLAAVTIHCEKQHKKHNHTKRNKSKTETQTSQTTHPNQQTSNLESDRQSSPETSEEGEVITLYQLRYWYGRKQDKRKHTNITLPYHRMSEATQHYAETRDSPQPGSPRSHRASHQA